MYNAFETEFYLVINRCYQFQVDPAFREEYVPKHVRWRHNDSQTEKVMPTSNIHVNDNVQISKVSKLK